MSEEREITYPALHERLLRIAFELLLQLDAQRGAYNSSKPWAKMSDDERRTYVERNTDSGTIPGKMKRKDIEALIMRLRMHDQFDFEGNRIVVVGGKEEAQITAYVVYRILRSEDGFTTQTIRSHISSLLPRMAEEDRKETIRNTAAFILDTALDFLAL